MPTPTFLDPAFRGRDHDVHVRLRQPTYRELTAFAAKSGLAINASVRVFVERQLEAEKGRMPETTEELARQLRSLSGAVLANLISTELNQLFLVKVFPRGEEIRDDLVDEAARTAHRRLMQMDAAIREEGS